MNQISKQTSWKSAALAAVLLLGAGCAGTAPPPAPVRNQITGVEVQPGAGGFDIRITGSSAPDAKIFKLTDPVRLVVDIGNSDVSALSPAIQVNNDVIQDISVSSTGAGAVGRLVVTLKDNVPYEQRTEGNTLIVQVSSAAAAQAPSEAAAAAAPAPADEFSSFEETPAAAGGDEFAAAAPAAAAPGQAAGKVTSVSVKATGGGVELVVAGDGDLPDPDSFTLDTPNRLVVDIPNVTNGTGADTVDAAGVPGVKAVTLSQLEDRVRVVVEHDIANFDYQVSKQGSQLLATLRSGGAAPKTGTEEFVFEEPPAEQAAGAQAAQAGSAQAAPSEEFGFEEAPAQAAPAAGAEAYPVAAAAAVPEGGTAAKVTAVDFLPGQESTSVKISFEGDVQTEIVDTSDTEVTVRILNTTLPQSLVRALDTSRYVGPVSMVKSFVEAAEQGEQGRILINLRSHAAYQVRKEAGALYLDFPTAPPAVAAAQPAEAAGVESGAPKAAELEAFDIGQAAAAEASPESLTVGAAEAKGLPGAAGADLSQTYQGRKISLEFREADIRDVLQLIAEVSQLNMIAADDIKGSITITLKNVPWDQALDIILETNGLGKKVVGNVVRIAKREQLASEEEARLAAQQTQEQLEPLSFQIIPVNYADAKDLQGRIKDLLSQRGTVAVDERTNSLLIKDIRRSIDQAIETIRALDTQTGLVLIEARIVTTTLSFIRELGVQWGGRFLSAPSVGNNLGSNVIRNNFMVDLPITGIGQRAGSSVGFSFGTLSQAFNIDVILSAAESSGQSRLVASPRVSVLDNTDAEVKTGISVPITTVQGGTISTTFVDAVLLLKVKPQITTDNAVIMNLEVKDNTINTAIPTAFGNPAINKNEAKTILLVRDGTTVVIGGIIKAQDGFSEIGVPFFNKIPFLGYMFRTRRWSDDRQEILVFLTPQIVRN